MADTTITGTIRPVVGALSAGFGRLFSALVAVAESNGRVRRMQALSALSDAELASRGVRREDITRYVLTDAYYI